MNIKLTNYSIGGSLVRVAKSVEAFNMKTASDWLAFDISLFIPLNKYFIKYKKIKNIKIGIGVFKTGLANKNKFSPLMPTYSIDIKI